MTEETIDVKTEDDKHLKVIVTNKKPDAIWILLGDEEQSLKCKLIPTRNQRAYVGEIMGREILYERSVAQVKEDLNKQNRSDPLHRKPVKKY